jgi:hypothetical protein
VNFCSFVRLRISRERDGRQLSGKVLPKDNLGCLVSMRRDSILGADAKKAILK